jgi:hypothetical protein
MRKLSVHQLKTEELFYQLDIFPMELIGMIIRVENSLQVAITNKTMKHG